MGVGFGWNVLAASMSFDGTYAGIETTQVSPALIGWEGVFDFTYGEVGLGAAFRSTGTPTAYGATPAAGHFAISDTALAVDVTAKLPLAVGPISIYPLVGAGYALPVSVTDDTSSTVQAQLFAAPLFLAWGLHIRFGVGVDVPFVDLLGMHLEASYSLSPAAGGQDTLGVTHSQGSLAITNTLSGFEVRLVSVWKL